MPTHGAVRRAAAGTGRVSRRPRPNSCNLDPDKSEASPVHPLDGDHPSYESAPAAPGPRTRSRHTEKIVRCTTEMKKRRLREQKQQRLECPALHACRPTGLSPSKCGQLVRSSKLPIPPIDRHAAARSTRRKLALHNSRTSPRFDLGEHQACTVMGTQASGGTGRYI